MHRHTLQRSVLFLCIATVLLLVPQVTSAQLLQPSQQLVSGATSLVSLLISIFNFLTWFFLMILDFIMDPQFIFGTDPNGGDGPLLLMLREIWQFSRDLVNLGFALGLIIGAVLMIVTADGTKIKEHLPKFVLAVVLVNFSWFIPRVIFDVSQVLTYTVYQLPSLLGDNQCTLPPTDTLPRRPCEVILQFKFFNQANGIINGVEGWRCPLPSIVCYQSVPINDARAENLRTSTKVLDGLIVNHAKLQWLVQIRPTEAEVRLPNGINNAQAFIRFASIIIKLIVVLLIHVALLFPIIAMTAAFFIRIPILWVSMAFMPLIALGFAFPKLREGEYADLFWKWQEHFLQAVFLPVRVAIPFVIGFIMLNAGSGIDMPMNFDGLNVNIVPIIVGVNNLWQILWMGVAITIIWKYSFDALKGDKAGFMGMFTERIQSIGSSLGSVAMQIPTSIPFIPMPGRMVPDGRGGQVQERASIGQLLRGADPRRWRDELRLGRFDAGSAGRVLGLQGSQVANPQAVNRIRANMNVATNINTVHFENALRTPNNPAALQQLTAGFEELRTHYSLGPLSNEQVLINLQQAGAIDAARHKQLEDLLRDIRSRPPAPP